MVVENRPGASGTLAAGAVARAPADGRTLLLANSGHSGTKALYPALPYDPVADFAAVVGVAATPNVVLVKAGSRFGTIQDLIAAARAKPGDLNFGAGGGGPTLTALSAELLKRAARIDAVQVNYAGSGPAALALLSGEIDFSIDTLSSAIGQVEQGQVKALAVTSRRRAARLPAVPTLDETVAPGFDVTGWFGVLAPAGTPAPAVERLNRDLNAALETPAVVGPARRTRPGADRRQRRELRQSAAERDRALGRADPRTRPEAGVTPMPREQRTEILVVGGGLGGVSAALAALEVGARVVLTEEFDWLGGQLTTQGVPLDEGPWIESGVGSRSYAGLRERIRDHYRRNYPLTAAARRSWPLNPGMGNVGTLCVEPAVAVRVIDEMLGPWQSAARLTVLRRHRPVAAQSLGDRVTAVALLDLATGRELTVEAALVVDATETGELLELA